MRFYIRDIDSSGRIYVEFSELLQIPSNLTQFEESALGVYILTANEERRNLLNFTWNLLEFRPGNLIMQIQFENSLAVS